MSASLRDRVKQLLMENAEPTPGTYFGNGYCCRRCGDTCCRGCMGMGYGGMISGGAKPNPWIEAVKKYGSVKEAKKYYKKGVPTPQYLSQERKDEIRAKILMRKETAREKADEELANTLLAQRRADYKQAKQMAPKRFTDAKAKALIKKVEAVANNYDFSDEYDQVFKQITDLIASIPLGMRLSKRK